MFTSYGGSIQLPLSNRALDATPGSRTSCRNGAAVEALGGGCLVRSVGTTVRLVTTALMTPYCRACWSLASGWAQNDGRGHTELHTYSRCLFFPRYLPLILPALEWLC
jgi:hypothetical protein